MLNVFIIMLIGLKVCWFYEEGSSFFLKTNKENKN